MTLYAALDVSLRSVNIFVIDEEGEFKADTKLDSEVTDIIAYLDGLGLEIASVGLEAGRNLAAENRLWQPRNERILMR